MKTIIGKIGLLVAMTAICACTEMEDLSNSYSVSPPATLEAYKYLNDYLPLKSYVNRMLNPNFKLGTGIMSSEFNERGLKYKLAVSNYDEVTSGYEMKHAAVVQDDGSMNFGTVQSFLMTAKMSGVSVFGHTLCWHENQNAKYLNSLIAPIPVESVGETIGDNIIADGGFDSGTSNWYAEGGKAGQPTRGQDGSNYFCSVTKNGTGGNFWEAQLAYNFPAHLTVGETYECEITFKGSKEGKLNNIGVQSSYDWSYAEQHLPGDMNSWSDDIAVTTEWKTIKTRLIATKDHNRMVITYGEYDGTLSIDNVSIKHIGASVMLGPNLVLNGNFENGDLDAGWKQSGSVSGTPARVLDGDGNYVCAFSRKSGDANYWDAELAYYFAQPLKAGVTYQCEIRFKSSVDGYQGNHINSISFQTSNDGTYDADPFPNDVSWIGIYPTKEWRTMKIKITPKKDRQRLNITYGDYKNGTIYIDNVVVRQEVTEAIERTPEEKKEIVTAALENWISKMMAVCKDDVKAWDVVNEPMDKTELKTGVGKTLNSDEFYWQDYMGKDYAVKAIEFARKYGNEGDLLFINEYSLESSLSKCDGLIAYIQYVESKGAKVDGIGTQMHITTAADTVKIRTMFQKLAATGKLIKISEFDMGLPGGKKTADATEEDYLAQKALYKYVVKTYFEEIPAAQRYGITHWNPLDAQPGAWRGGEPIGLWDVNYYRKHAYAGFADGLKAQ